MINFRHKCSAPGHCWDNHTHLGRGVAVSIDEGDTFGAVSYDARLSDPICQGSIVSYGGATYFSNQASNSSRSHLTIKNPTDNTRTWGKSLLVQAEASSGCSCLVKARIPRRSAIIESSGKASTDGGVLYESTGGTIKFSRFPLSL